MSRENSEFLKRDYRDQEYFPPSGRQRQESVDERVANIVRVIIVYERL